MPSALGEGKPGTLTVVVVTYNSAATISRCLSSLPTDAQILVVDNCSSDTTKDIVSKDFPNVTLIQNPANAGFGAANNIGLERATGEFALLLNPDAWAKSNAVSKLADFIRQHRDAVACGGRLEFADGSLQNSCSNELTLWAVFCEQTLLERIFHCYWISHKARGPMQVAQVMGACLMMRRMASGDFARFDTNFFLYCEDTELCKRLSRFGAIWYVPEAVFGHELGLSSTEERWKAVAYYNRGKELYFRVHRGRFAMFICFLLDRLGALLRSIIWLLASLATLFLVKFFRKRLKTFLKVLTAPVDPYRSLNRI